MQFQKDDFVRLPADQGGAVGRVVEEMAGDKVRIQFPGQSIRTFVASLCPLTKVEDGDETRAVAELLLAPIRKAGKNVRPLGELIELFKTEFPDGFIDKKYEADERNHKVKASERLHSSLGKDDFAALLAAGQFEEISNRARALLSATNLAHQFDVIPLQNALKRETSWRPFGEGLFELLYGEAEGEPRFTRFVATLEGLRAARWPISTYFQFLARPQEEIFLKPDATKKVAVSCGVELRYKSAPNWLTYSAVLTLSKKLGAALTAAGLPPKDLIDIQSFIWCASRLEKGQYR